MAGREAMEVDSSRVVAHPHQPGEAQHHSGPITEEGEKEAGEEDEEEEGFEDEPLLDGHDDVAAAAAVGAPPSSLQLRLVVALHFIVGVSNNIPGVANRRFLLEDLAASPATQAMIGVLSGLPWNLKLLWAFCSDSFPILGQRRKPYLVGGIVLQAVGWILLGSLSPAIGPATVCMFTATMGQVLVGVMCDTLVVENMRHEAKERSGELQSSCWIALNLGNLLGMLGGGWGLQFSGATNRQMFQLNSGLKLCLVLVALLLTDPRVARAVGPSGGGRGAGGMRQKVRHIWASMQEHRVWKPVVFIFVYAMCPSNHDAFVAFLLGDPSARDQWPNGVRPLKFSDSQYGYLMAVGTFGSAVGAWVYKTFLREASWHILFSCTILLSSALSASQLVLIHGLNRKWDIPDIWFALGDETINDVAQFLIMMPMLVLMSRICPQGVEGSVFALVTSLQMVGSSVGGTFSSLATSGYGVTQYDFTNLSDLTLTTSVIKALPILLLPLLPARPSLAGVGTGASVAGGLLLAVALVGGLGWSLGAALFKLVHAHPQEMPQLL